MIKIRNLFKSFNGKQVLRGLNLDIYENEVFVIMGGSGSGKSVLLKHIMGLMKPNSGEIFIDDDNMVLLEGEKLLHKLMTLGTVFQGSALFDSMTIEENVSFYLKEHSLQGGRKIQKSDIKNIVKESLKSVGLEGTEELYPSSLSGGMKKRAAIARCIAFRPRCVFYDEPTTGLDPVTGTTIAHLMLSLHKEHKGTTVMVSHDPYITNMIADRIALIDDGKIAALGTPIEFFTNSHPTIKLFFSMLGNNKEILRTEHS